MNTANTVVPLQLFVNNQLLCLSTDCQAGLILKYRHYASFAGVGAAVGGCLDVTSLSIYPIGDVRFIVPETQQQRQLAYQQRISYARTLCKITSVYSPSQRAYLIVRQLCQWLDPKIVKAIPNELIGQLVGVLPKSIDAAWQQYLQHCHYRSTPIELPHSIVSCERSYGQKCNVGSVQVPVTVLNL